jgi:hypothetical protein
LESPLRINQIGGPIGLRTISQENLVQPQSWCVLIFEIIPKT